MTVKVNFAIEEETVQKIKELCRVTFRRESDLVDWLVAEEWARRYNSQPNPGVSVAEAQAASETEN